MAPTPPAAKQKTEGELPAEAPTTISNFPPSKGGPTCLAELQEGVSILLGHGPYQRRMLVSGILCVGVAITQFLSYSLISRPVDHWCRPPVHLAHLPVEAWKNRSLPIEADGSFSKCTMLYPALENPDSTNRTLVACHSWEYDIGDKGDSVASRFDLVCNRQFLYPLSLLFTTLGYTILAPAAGFASDRVGRKPVAIVCAFVVVFSMIGCSVARTFTFFVINRVLAIAAASGAFIVTFILLYEGTGPAWRWQFLLLQSAVPSILVPPIVDLISLLRPSWILAHGLMITPVLIFAVWSLSLEESPAWLLAKWKLREAEEGVLRAAKTNGQDLDKVRVDFAVMRRKLLKLKDGSERASICSASEYIHETIRMRRRAVAAFFARFTLTSVYFGAIVTDNRSEYFWLGVYIVLSTSVYGFIIVAANRYGIRETLCAVLAITCCGAVTKFLVLLSGDSVVADLVHVGIEAVAGGATSIVLCYVADVFPTKIRSAGVSLSVFFGGMGSFVGIFIAKLKSKPESIYFNMYATLMTLLSIAAVQYLPQVILEKSNNQRSVHAPSMEERKLALKFSLAPFKTKKARGNL